MLNCLLIFKYIIVLKKSLVLFYLLRIMKFYDVILNFIVFNLQAYRVVLVVVCFMLYFMKNVSVGFNLEVRLVVDIKVDVINIFFQYLYEGFMMLIEENIKDVEKIVRVLQVDSVLKCCVDFYKCLYVGDKYEYSFYDNVEFKYVRVLDFFKVYERNKRIFEI